MDAAKILTVSSFNDSSTEIILCNNAPYSTVICIAEKQIIHPEWTDSSFLSCLYAATANITKFNTKCRNRVDAISTWRFAVKKIRAQRIKKNIKVLRIANEERSNYISGQDFLISFFSKIIPKYLPQPEKNLSSHHDFQNHIPAKFSPFR